MLDKNSQDTDQTPLTQAPLAQAEARPIPATTDKSEREKWRCLPFDGPRNFRDMGGYLNEEGKAIKWGVIYRADRLSALTDADMDYFKRLNIRKIIDFRSDHERKEAPSRTDALEDTQTLWMEVFEGGAFVEDMWRSLFSGDLSDASHMHDMMRAANRRFVSHHHNVFADFFKLLLEDENIPLLFHCMGGKDRTGFAAAMILSALKVPEDVIMQDYLLTNTLTASSTEIRKKNLRDRLDRDISDDLLDAVMKVQADYLQAGFETIHETYGSVEGFLKEGLGLGVSEMDELHRRYLAAD